MTGPRAAERDGARAGYGLSVIPVGLPPGPRGKLRTTARLLRRPYEAFPAWAKRYGDPFTINAVNGVVVTTGRPELIKQIFAHDPDDYAPFGAAALEVLIGPRSVFLLEGHEHKRERKLLMPQFHGDRMRAYGQAMVDVARRHFGRAADGERVKLLDLGQGLTLEIILRAIFGVDEIDRLRRFEAAIVDTIDHIHPMFVFAPFTAREFGGVGPYARFARRLRTMDEMLSEQIARVKASPEPGQDILSLMVAAEYDDGSKMSDEQLRDELITLVVAGHETTAISLAWIVHCLGQNPGVHDDLRSQLVDMGDEVTPGDLAGHPYLGAVCDESLRLFPIITEVIRTLKAPMKLGELEVPAGCCVAASAPMAHYNPALYPEPHTFKPERFLDKRPSPFEYLPFGGGHRRCLGAPFANYELRVVLGTLLREFDLDIIDEGPEPPVRRNVTMAPGRGVPVRLRRREP